MEENSITIQPEESYKIIRNKVQFHKLKSHLPSQISNSFLNLIVLRKEMK